MKTKLFSKMAGTALLMAVLTSGAIAQTSGTTGTRATPYPGVRQPVNPKPATPQEGMPPVMGAQQGAQQNRNGLSMPPSPPPQNITPLSPAFTSNAIVNQPTRRGTFAATNPPPNVTAFPFTNATGPFPSNPALNHIPQ